MTRCPHAHTLRSVLTRRVLALLIATVVSTLGLSLVSIQSASAWGVDDLTVNGSCYTYESKTSCSTTLRSPVLDNEHNYSVTMSAINLDTGQPVAGFAAYMPSLLPAGNYEVTAVVKTLGHWWCSAYNKDGCTWIESGTSTTVWRFFYPGSGTITVARYVPVATTDIAQARIKSKRGVWIVTGILTATIGSEYALEELNAAAGRQVQIQRKSGRWKTVATGTTNSIGRFTIRWREKSKKPSRFRIVAPATAAATEDVAYWKGKL